MNGRWGALNKALRKTSYSDVSEQGDSLGGMIESGDFQLDLHRRTATLRGEELLLSSDEFDVLVFLAAHPQSLVTPRTMLTTRWTASSAHKAEFLRALVSLRKKLDEAGPGQHYLRTEPWVVYRFDPNPSSSV